MSVRNIVVDSSVIVKWLSADNEKYLSQADKLLFEVEKEKVRLYAPELAKYEVTNALLKGKKLPKTVGEEALSVLYSLPIQYILETLELAQIAYGIGKELNITYYDASFMALAYSLNAVLVTDNIKHQKQTKNVKVVNLKDY